MALDGAVQFLKHLENYVSFDYELPKMSHAAIPDFAAGNEQNYLKIQQNFNKIKFSGAMENWGLITYKEQYLIGNEQSHHYDILEILLTVAHELSHQFFGNVVTCKWWDYVWLNEGFATLFEYLLVDLAYPDTRPFNSFNVNKLQNVMKIDALATTHPITYEGESSIYEITYHKGEHDELLSLLGRNQSYYPQFSWKRNPNVPICRRRRNFPPGFERLSG